MKNRDAPAKNSKATQNRIKNIYGKEKKKNRIKKSFLTNRYICFFPGHQGHREPKSIHLNVETSSVYRYDSSQYSSSFKQPGRNMKVCTWIFRMAEELSLTIVFPIYNIIMVQYRTTFIFFLFKKQMKLLRFKMHLNIKTELDFNQKRIRDDGQL